MKIDGDQKLITVFMSKNQKSRTVPFILDVP